LPIPAQPHKRSLAFSDGYSLSYCSLTVKKMSDSYPEIHSSALTENMTKIGSYTCSRCQFKENTTGKEKDA